MNHIKICYKCKQEKHISDFNKDKTRKNGLSNICKICCNKKSKKWRLLNKKEVYKYQKTKSQNDICYRIIINSRRRLRKALKNNQKHGHTIDLIMCSISELKIYLESLWKPGMSWDNYGFGNNKWNIDHIIPMSFFNLTDPVEQYMCCRYQNLQPMWQTENFKKGKNFIQKKI